jgi:hypothetical protein
MIKVFHSIIRIIAFFTIIAIFDIPFALALAVAVEVGLYLINKPKEEWPKNNTDYKKIIGKPIKIGDLEITQYDFPKKMNWHDAKKACETLGDGWRLPTKDELNSSYFSQIDGVYFNWYWSSTLEHYTMSNEYLYSKAKAALPTLYSKAWLQYFGEGGGYQINVNMKYKESVRAVRAF